MPFNSAPGLSAGSNVAPSSFVVLDTTNPFSVVQSGLNGRAIAIVKEGQKQPPGVLGSDQLIAGQGASSLSPYGDQVAVYALGDLARIRVSSTVTQGDGLKSDASGWAQTAITGDIICAYALESGTQSQLVRCIVQTPVKL